jgi:hypothetical protein
VAKKKKKVSRENSLVQVTFKASVSQYEAMYEACQMLHIDMSSLLRIMISQHVGEYIAMGKKGNQDLEQARSKQSSEPLSSPHDTKVERGLDLR